MVIINWLLLHWLDVIGAIGVACAGLIPVFQLIPGNQPEKFLQSIVDFIAKFSKK
jgi:hypothetical protein